MLIRAVNAIRGAWLMLFNLKTFKSELLNNKRIAIVGPASSAYNSGKGAYIDTFDIVIRINKAPLLIRDGRSAIDIGTKTDILFHSFFENEVSGGGALDFALYDSLGIKYVINPFPNLFGHRATFNFFKKYRSATTVYTLPRKTYARLTRRFETFLPTTGLCALQFALSANFSELYITGFTFFKTAYGEGYRHYKEPQQAIKYMAEMKTHNPDLEFEEFKILLGENRGKNIGMDDTLAAILREN